MVSLPQCRDESCLLECVVGTQRFVGAKGSHGGPIPRRFDGKSLPAIDPKNASNPEQAAAIERALNYMGLKPGKQAVPHQLKVFLGFCWTPLLVCPKWLGPPHFKTPHQVRLVPKRGFTSQGIVRQICSPNDPNPLLNRQFWKSLSTMAFLVMVGHTKTFPEVLGGLAAEKIIPKPGGFPKGSVLFPVF